MLKFCVLSDSIFISGIDIYDYSIMPQFDPMDSFVHPANAVSLNLLIERLQVKGVLNEKGSSKRVRKIVSHWAPANI